MKIKRRTIPDTHSQFSFNSPVLKRIYLARGIYNLDMLDHRMQRLISFTSFKDIEKACDRLESAIRNHEHILVVGDFDADGATSTAVAVSALKAMGTAKVSYLVPNRFKFGYGLTPGLVEIAKTMNPNLIITVDNGIANIEGVQAARDHGIDTIVTDHHLPAETLPKAVAIVNPNQLDCSFPSKTIAGVGVIFYVMAALRQQLLNSGWFTERNITPPNMASYLDLVALGTIADVVGLDHNNRILVNQGLLRIRQGKSRPGITALIRISGREYQTLRESDLGFAIAPRLNAAGRLDDMSIGISCLLAESEDVAQRIAQQLDSLNSERRALELDMKAEAIDLVEKQLTKLEKQVKELPLGLCLFSPTWHQGIIGILAGRIKEKYHRPVIAFAQTSDTEMKASARSIVGVNIRDVLADIDVQYPGLITKFGGHAMAAGLTILPEKLAEFESAFHLILAKYLDIKDCNDEILTDGSLEAPEITLSLAQLIQNGGPWGQQFPEPIFDGIFEVLDQRLVGNAHLKLTLVAQDSDEPLDAIAFNVELNQWPNHRARYIHIAYRLDTNTYRGRTKLQLLIVGLTEYTGATIPA